MSSWWEETRESTLAQGDHLPACMVPFLPSNYGERDTIEITLRHANLIVITQSCDLVNGKADTVVLCPVMTIGGLQQIFPQYQAPKNLEPLRQGRVNGLHLLAGFQNPADNLAALVVDFRQLYSLPFAYLCRRAEQLGTRSRLQSPPVL